MSGVELRTCFECTDNLIRCGENGNCPDRNTCFGCKICHTGRFTPCPHCVIECKKSNLCQTRDDWETSGFPLTKTESSSISLREKMNCAECDYDYYCMLTNECPDEMDPQEQAAFKAYQKFEKMSEDDMSKKKRSKNGKTKSVMIPSTVVYRPPDSDVWESKIDCITECPHKSKLKIHISLEVVLKLQYLQTQFPDHEFTVYGDMLLQDEKYILNDIIIPKQTVSFAAVDDIVVEGNHNTIIHKHPGKTPGGFSGTDNEFANSNHDFSILIGSEGLNGVLGIARKKVECGRLMKAELEFVITTPSVTDEKFLSSINNIEKKVWATVQSYGKNGIKSQYDEWYANRGFY